MEQYLSIKKNKTFKIADCAVPIPIRKIIFAKDEDHDRKLQVKMQSCKHQLPKLHLKHNF